MSYYLFMLVLFLAVIPLTNGRNYSSPSGIPHIHPPNPPSTKPRVTIHPPFFGPKRPPGIWVPGAPHIHPPRPSRPPP